MHWLFQLWCFLSVQLCISSPSQEQRAPPFLATHITLCKCWNFCTLLWRLSGSYFTCLTPCGEYWWNLYNFWTESTLSVYLPYFTNAMKHFTSVYMQHSATDHINQMLSNFLYQSVLSFSHTSNIIRNNTNHMTGGQPAQRFICFKCFCSSF